MGPRASRRQASAKTLRVADQTKGAATDMSDLLGRGSHLVRRRGRGFVGCPRLLLGWEAPCSSGVGVRSPPVRLV
jgi:hypothetical protein